MAMGLGLEPEPTEFVGAGGGETVGAAGGRTVGAAGAVKDVGDVGDVLLIEEAGPLNSDVVVICVASADDATL